MRQQRIVHEESHEAGNVQKIDAVFATEGNLPMMTERRRTNWIPIALQTIVLIGAIIGLAIANEHRITKLEECAATTSQNLKDALDTVKVLQSNKVRVLLILDGIERRNQNEDESKGNRR